MINTERKVNTSTKLKANACPVSLSARSKIKIFLLKLTGLFCVGLAILGAILPVLPTTVFLIMAAGCFAKSSPRMQQKLLENKIFGPLIHDWQEHRSIPIKAKRIALLSIILSVCWSAYMLQSTMLTALVVALVIGPFIFLLRLPLSK
ncbi:YbaN family protein [Colwellia piezophila]|uniref:YbaN family protein n=1 Tax=Colwellia piezophila TaxID=211668 RepID=UPI00037B57DF|nr:YbaN family protein [Colwellia piezophila]